jgi:hypothetical protein
VATFRDLGVTGNELDDSPVRRQFIEGEKNRPGFGGLADATERGESSGAVLPE